MAEYWRFDETGEFHGARLGGDILVEGRYEPVSDRGGWTVAFCKDAAPY